MQLLTETQQEILDLIKKYQRLTVDQLTQKLGVAKTAVRRNLLLLERRGILEKEWVKIARGRPQLAFRLTVKSGQLFPNKEAELLEALIVFLQRQGLEKWVEAFFESYWEEKYRQVMDKVQSRKCQDFSSRLEALTEVLELEGFYPRTRLFRKKSELQLTECHCPISAASRVTDIPCRMEKRLVERVLQCRGERTDHCVLKLDLKNGNNRVKIK